MPTCRDIDAQIVDLLYGELDSPVEASFREHITTCADCTALLASFSWIRALMSELPLEDAPVAVSNIVMHEAGKRASSGHSARDGETAGLWAWLSRLFQPVLAHPAAASLATLVLIATVGGVIYTRSGSQIAEPVISSNDDPSRERLDNSAATAPYQPSSPSPAAAPGSTIGGEGEDERAQDNKREYQVDVTSAEQRAELADEDGDGNADMGKARGPGRGQIEGLSGNRSFGKDDQALTETPEEELALDTEDDGAPTDSLGGGADMATLQTRSGAVQTADKTAPVAREPAPRKAGKKRMKRSSASTTRAPTARPPAPPPQATPGAISAPATDEFARGGDDAKKADEKTTWAMGQHAQLRLAISAKRCEQAARIVNDIRERDRRYYDANLRNDATLKPCATYIARETSRRSERRRAKAKRASKKANADESAADQAAEAAE